ncbi:MAG: TolC family outer membrane protein [Burkholderiaceae bacterium]
MRKPLLATCIAAALLSQSAYALDLLQVYREALANDPVYASARYSLQAGQEAEVQGRAGLLPQIGLSGSYNRNDSEVERRTGTTTEDSKVTTYRASLTQPLFRWANWQQYQQGKLSVAVSEAEFAQAQQDLILRVSQAYFDVLAAQDALASVQAQKAAITEQLASAKRNFEVGTATITDTHEAQARFDLAVAQEFAAQSDLDVKRAALEQIIGKPAGELASLRTGVQLSGPQPAQLDAWVNNAQSRNYRVVSQEFNREISQREISRLQGGHLPTVDVVASRDYRDLRGRTATDSTDNIRDGTTIGVQVNIPLFSGFAVTSQVREAVALSEKARTDLENARRSAAQEARQAFLGVNSGLAQVRALEAAEISSQSALESNRLGYEVGVRINIDVLNAQQQLYVTRRDLSKARYDTLVNSLRLKSAAGTLSEDDLAQVNTLLGAPLTPANLYSDSARTAKAQAAGDATAEAEKQVLEVLQGWAAAWSARDARTYLSYYSKDFETPPGQSRRAWEAQRKRMLSARQRIDVKVETPAVRIDGNTATVSFRQAYASDSHQETGDKTLVLSRQDGAWKIIEERAGN